MKISSYSVHAHRFAILCAIFILSHLTPIYALDAPLKQPPSSSKANESASAVDSPSECPGDVSQNVLVQCMRNESMRYDQEVTKEFNSAIALLSKADLPDKARENVKGQFIAAQHAWEIYRKLDCESRVAFLDNSDSAVLEYWDCTRRHARQRIWGFHLFLNN